MLERRQADRVEIPVQPVSGPPMGRRTALAVIGGAVAGLSGFILGALDAQSLSGCAHTRRTELQ